MKKAILITFTSIFCLLLTAFTIQAVINWQIDNTKAQVKFTIMSDGKPTNGFFTGVKGDINFDKDNLAGSYFNCTIDVATINTGMGGRDKHLRTADFFDVEKYPVATFKSTKIEKDSVGYKAIGDLTIKAATKHIIIPFTFDDNKDNGVFKGAVTIDRNDYGVSKPDPEPDPIAITIEIPVTKK
jgi:polyisoprenoid-binding protein YceI